MVNHFFRVRWGKTWRPGLGPVVQVLMVLSAVLLCSGRIVAARLEHNLGMITLTRHLLAIQQHELAVTAGFSRYTEAISAPAAANDQLLAQLSLAQERIVAAPALYRRFGRVFHYYHAEAAAVMALEAAQRLTPENRTITQELAELYDHEGRHDQATALWTKLAPTPSQQVALADDYLERRQVRAALHWYNLAVAAQPDLEPTIAFRRAVAALLAEDSSAQDLVARAQQLDPGFEIFPLNAVLTIEGDRLRWLTRVPAYDITFGTSLAWSMSTVPTVGRFWWSGEAVALVDTVTPGRYWVELRLLHAPPAPVEMALGVDGRQLHRLQLDRGDGSWEIFTIPLQFDPGVHVLNIWFLNNEELQGVDRDAAIDWIRLTRAAL